jgi:hypothetical protein
LNKVLIGDVDIDVSNRDIIIEELDHITVAMKTHDGFKKHNTGIYVQDVPFDPHTGLALFDHKDKNYKDISKIDILNFNVLKNFISSDQLATLINMEPDWTLLNDRDFVERTTHIHKWFELIQKKKIDSVDKLAMFLGIIRPGKESLRYKPWNEIEESVWQYADSGYVFKKSHAYGYALTIVALMNLESGR